MLYNGRGPDSASATLYNRAGDVSFVAQSGTWWFDASIRCLPDDNYCALALDMGRILGYKACSTPLSSVLFLQALEYTGIRFCIHSFPKTEHYHQIQDVRV